MEPLLEFLFAPVPADAIDATTLDAHWWTTMRTTVARFDTSIDRAIASGALSPGVGAAFAGGYQWAVHRLSSRVPEASIAALCATEKGGGHPRAIETALRPHGNGLALFGRKRYVTLGTAAESLLVVATRGENAGRKQLVIAMVPSAREGVRVRPAAPTPFVPDVPHAELELDGVRIEPDEIFPGDGFEAYVKPFRTIEDCHVFGAVLGYLCRIARVRSFSQAAREALLAHVVTIRTLALCDPASPVVHLALAGALAAARASLTALDDEWTSAPADERERWLRDRVLLSVAETARGVRTTRAWERVEPPPAP